MLGLLLLRELVFQLADVIVCDSQAIFVAHLHLLGDRVVLCREQDGERLAEGALDNVCNGVFAADHFIIRSIDLPDFLQPLVLPVVVFVKVIDQAANNERRQIGPVSQPLARLPIGGVIFHADVVLIGFVPLLAEVELRAVVEILELAEKERVIHICA